MTRPLLSIEGLQVRFGDDPPAVCDASLSVHPGQTVALVGESGSGKSTTAAAVLGLLAPGGRVTKGCIEFDGQDITHADRRRLQAIRGRQIGYVPQDPMTNLNPVWTIGFQIRETLRANGIADRRGARKTAVELLERVGMTDSALRSGRYPHQLSGGMCQRALIAIGLAGQPRLLIADEPTSALDVTVQKQVLDHLHELTARSGTAVLLITHDLAPAAERAKHLVVMHRGEVVESGAAQGIVDGPQHEYTQRLVSSAPSLAMRRGPAVRGRVLTQAAAHARPIDDLLTVSKVSKVYRVGAPWRQRDITAVDDVSFSVRRATTTAVVGESGSGKTTIARIALALLTPTAGTVTFDGADISALNRRAAKAFAVERNRCFKTLTPAWIPCTRSTA